ncbi:MAG: SAM-dependent methyltransferase, partial [Steroidobacteraceae bacterium]|nr:SAM-dependent methyltransferase [Steroidobacteraceae bacterium]
MSNRTIPLTDSMYDYLLDVSSREPPVLRALREHTLRMSQRSMQIAPEQ